LRHSIANIEYVMFSTNYFVAGKQSSNKGSPSQHVRDYPIYCNRPSVTKRLELISDNRGLAVGTPVSYSAMLIEVFRGCSQCLQADSQIVPQIISASSILCPIYIQQSSYQPRGLRRRFESVRLLGLQVRISPGAWMFVSWEYCALSGRGLCEGPIPRPEESYRIWCVCDREASIMSTWPTGGCGVMEGKQKEIHSTTRRYVC
jgi:hypothetical protein